MAAEDVIGYVVVEANPASGHWGPSTRSDLPWLSRYDADEEISFLRENYPMETVRLAKLVLLPEEA